MNVTPSWTVTVADSRSANHEIENLDLLYIDPPFFTQRDFVAFDDRWDSFDVYINLIKASVSAVVAHNQNFNIIVHVDPRTSHYIKVALDKILGHNNFTSEIIWNYNSGGAGKNALAKKHDVMLHYRLEDAPFNILREPYATPNVTGREGFNDAGRMLTDVWSIPIISTTGKERTGYPTQKPLALLDRIVQVFSNEGNTVMDTFCGSGTTGVAALMNRRNFIGSDISEEAVTLTKERLAHTEAMMQTNGDSN